MKKILTTLALTALLTVGVANVSAQTAPKSVIHVVTVSWKEASKEGVTPVQAAATPEQIKAALDGAHALPAKYPGITHVWTKAIKNQTDKANIIIMEFADEAALKNYTDSDAQKEWYKVYLPIRGRSTTFDVTN